MDNTHLPLFPPTEPFAHGMLPVGNGHSIHWEQCGNPDGIPAVFLHGGPGSGCNAQHRRLLDPARYCIVLFDQRGCGRSTPRGETRHNTTAHLVADIERLRVHLGIARWLVFGGSWGSSLAVAYAGAHPDSCLGAILRGVFLTGTADLDWFFDTASALAPDAFATLTAGLGLAPGGKVLPRLFDVVERGTADEAALAVRHWMRWEATLSAPGRAPAALPNPGADELAALRDKYRIQAWYLRKLCFLDEAGVFGAAGRISGRMPVAIVHGRLDLICRASGAWALHAALPGSRLHLVDGAGHSPFEPPIARSLIGAGAAFACRGDFSGWPD